MDEEELKRIWQASNLAAEKINIQSPNLLSNMDQELKRFERRIRRRDNREIGVAILSIALFGVFGFKTPEITEQIGVVLIITYLIGVIFMLIRTKNQKPEFSVSLNLKEQLVKYRTYVLAQQRLLKRVLYWYILPMLPGVLFFYAGRDFNFSTILMFLLVSLALVWVYFLNQKAAKENFEPLLKELSIAIEKLKE